MKMMAKANVSFGFLCFLLSLVLCTSSRYTTTLVAGEERNVARFWCVARHFTDGNGRVLPPPMNPTDAELQGATFYYCSQKGVDCSRFIDMDEGPCSFAKPGLTKIQTQASVVFNLYYRAHGSTLSACPRDLGFLTPEDPSYFVNLHGTCKFP